jgi:FAD/FMN-containing dehydrogenase
MTSLPDSTLAAFRGSLGGTVLVAGDTGYDTARSVWNGEIDRHPAAIAQCASADDVSTAIAFARREGLEIAVRGGGHNYPGYAVCDDGLVVDLTTMRAITVDPAAKRVRCGGGTTWADLDAATQAHGLAVTGGFISHTGVGGLSLGGGLGWLTGKAGLTCDNLVSAHVVTADGEHLTASATSHPDLWWAIRGGGGNFGVVTEFEFALHDVGPLVQLGLFFWGQDQGVEMLTFARDFIETTPLDTGLSIVGLNAPPAPFVPEEHHFTPGYLLAVVGWGSPEEHAALVQPIRDALPPLFEFVTPIPYTELQKMLDESAPWGILAYEKAIYLDEMTDGAIAVIAEQLPRKVSPMSLMPIFTMRGAYAEVADDSTAFGGSRASKWLVNIDATSPGDMDLLAADRAWVRGFWDALLPHAGDSAGYVNFMVEADNDRLRATYGAEKYDRLARIKAEYDPDNVFHLNANIAPAP